MSLHSKGWLSLGVPTTPILPANLAGQFAQSTQGYYQLNQAKRQNSTLTLTAAIAVSADEVVPIGEVTDTCAAGASFTWTWQLGFVDGAGCLSPAMSAFGAQVLALKITSLFNVAPESVPVVVTYVASVPGHPDVTYTNNSQVSTGAIINAQMLVARNPFSPWLCFGTAAGFGTYASIALISIPIRWLGTGFDDATECEIYLFTGDASAWTDLPESSGAYFTADGVAGVIYGVPINYRAFNFNSALNNPSYITGGFSVTISDVNISVD